MNDYLKKFSEHSDYNTYINSQDKVLPNVSYCEDNNECHFNPWVETRVIAKFNVTSTSESTKIGYSYSTNNFSKIEIDDVVQPTVVNSYIFDTTGEHTIKYTLLDPTEIPSSGFEDCVNLTSVTIPNSVTTIGGMAFMGCTGLTSITIPNSVTSIVSSAFQSCTGLTSITIPSSVTSIGSSAFMGCTGLTSITVESGNTVYDSRNNCNAIIETATNKLITGCQNTIIPNTVTSIGNFAFDSCTFTSVIIPDSVTSIGDGAFDYCPNLISVIIPDSVTSIGEGAFGYCPNLISVTIQATTPPTLTSEYDNFTDNASGRKIYVPAESVNAYKTATNWSTLASSIQAIS